MRRAVRFVVAHRGVGARGNPSSLNVSYADVADTVPSFTIPDKLLLHNLIHLENRQQDREHDNEDDGAHHENHHWFQ